MGIWKKLEDVLRANVNDILDKASDPVKELGLRITDARDFRAKQVAIIGEAIMALKMIEDDLKQAESSVSYWTRKAADKASKDDGVAKAALKQLIQQEKLAAGLKKSLEENGKVVEARKMELTQLDEKIAYLESQRHVVEVRVRTAQAGKGIHAPISAHGGPSVDEILGRVEDKVRRLEAEAGAAAEVAEIAQPQTAEGRFKEEELDEEVEKRLADLKAKKEQEKK